APSPAAPAPGALAAQPTGDARPLFPSTFKPTQPAAPIRPSQAADAGAGAPDYPRFPALPPNWMFNPDTREFGRSQLKEWRQQQRQWKEQIRAAKRVGGQQAADQMAAVLQGTAATPEFRIQRFQRYAVGTVGTIAFLGVINGVTSPQFPWVIFPALGMGIGLMSRAVGLWLDGIPLSSIFTRQQVVLPAGASQGRAVDGASPARALPAHVSDGAVRQVLAKVPADVLAGPHGGALRGAADAKASILSTLASLSEADAKMLPPVTPTVDALIDRIAELVMSLHQLDQDASPDARRRLDERVAELRALPESAPDRERRLTLLERQQSTLSDLASRRDAVARSLDNATTLLDTMKLDLLKLRSSGLQSQFADQTLATQEARAVASEIERAIDVAAELRRL
ncbi:MAG: hypothetical protein K2X99_07855, partial [Gemmatimonadaceae bacterium]|nr:hypothetical protein [Gemmatimonadaceae bacterium]